MVDFYVNYHQHFPEIPSLRATQWGSETANRELVCIGTVNEWINMAVPTTWE
jgi:hypothetical protein